MPKKAIHRRADRYETLRNLLTGGIHGYGGIVATAQTIEMNHNTLRNRLNDPSTLKLSELVKLLRLFDFNPDVVQIAMKEILEGK